MAELMEYVKMLAEQIGPRPVSTEEEHQAALYIAQELTEEGLEVDVDEFATATGTRWPYALAFTSILVGALITGVGIFVESIEASMFVVGIIVMLFGLVVYYLEHSGRHVLADRRVGGVSQNVVARYVPSSVAREQRRRKVVIVSHVDTVRAQPEAMPALVQHVALLHKVLYVLAPLVLVITLVRVLPLPWPADVADGIDFGLWVATLVCSGILFIVALCIIANRFMPYLAGGNDNASGNAVLLGTAKRLLDPEERERFAVEQPAQQDEEHPVETFAPTQGTGSFAAVKPEGAATIRGEKAAREAGVVPEGAELTYAEDAEPEDEAAEEEPSPAPEPEPEPEPAKPLSAWEQRLRRAEGGAAQVAAAAAAAGGKAAAEPAKAAGMPSWYQAAKQKAAKAASAAEGAAATAGATAAGSAAEPAAGAPAYRSRFADVPLSGPVVREDPQAEAAAAQEQAGEAESEEAVERTAEEQQRAQDEALANVLAFKQPEGEGGEEEAPAGEPAEPVSAEVAEIRELLDLSLGEDEAEEEAAPAAGESGALPISDSDIEDIAPDDVASASATPAAAEEPAAEAAPAPAAQAGARQGFLRSLTSRIPTVGSSTSTQREDLSALDAPAKPERRKPTARRVSDDFQPTTVSDPRKSGLLPSLRQEAPISSTYEATEQAADPFAPRDALGNVLEAEAPQRGAQAHPRATPGVSASFEPVPASTTSSFPSLTGSFPSLSGTMPAVSAGDFGEQPAQEPDHGYDDVADDVADDFMSPAMTTEIHMPESRLHNAIDKVGGLFSRGKADDAAPKKEKKTRRKKERDSYGTGEADNWGDEDDYGWRGGGYLDVSESAFAAAKARASEIRESVVSMTESDLLDKEVWFVALGASEANNQGMKNFLELHGSELRGALIINLECVGAGELRYIDFEGKAKAHRCDRRLQSLVRSASRELTGLDMRSQRMTWRDTDATPAMEQGLRAMSIMGFEGMAPVKWHWKGDGVGTVDPDNLEYATKLMLKIIEEA